MPSYSTLDLVFEVYVAIASMSSSKFTLDQLVQSIDQIRRNKGVKTKVTPQSVSRILMRLWYPFGIRKDSSGYWEKGAGVIRAMTNLRPDIIQEIIRNKGINATATEIDHWIGLVEEPTTRKAYICYPYSDNPVRRSLELLILLVHLYPKTKHSFVPATPHEMYWRLQEKSNRLTAMTECEKLIERCDFVLYCLRREDTPSSGMKRDIEVAKRKEKKIEYIEDILGYYPNVNAIMKSCGLTEFITIDEKRVELPLQIA